MTLRLSFILMALSILRLDTIGQAKPVQPTLGYRSLTILQEEGYRFKDHNRNGKLDIYEDWRNTPEARARDLVSRMSVEQKAGFMLISTTRLENDWSFERPRNREPITSGFNENDLVDSLNLFTKKPLPYPIMQAAGTTKGVTRFQLRHFILRANVPARTIAEWSNRLQELCEAHGLGIPAIVTSNPRNHITRDASPGLSVGRTGFTAWPGELGLSATRDLRLVRDFAEMARQEWRSVGLRKGYMYMGDLATEPRWQRIEGTFGEDAAWAAKMMEQVVLGFQGQRLGNSSVALTTKHFPGGGATEGGHDPHFTWGRNEVFPGGMFRNNLIPFRAAIKAGTSSIMPYYSIPIGTPYEEVAYAYNKSVLQGLLRGELGFDGIINSDTGPIEMMPWGAEGLTIEQRYQKTLQAGINLYSGTADPTKLLATIRSGLAEMSLIDNSVYRLLLEKFRLGLFEDPYVDVDAAVATVGRADFKKRADEAFRKSIVLLRNDKSSLPLKAGVKVYFEKLTASMSAANPTSAEAVEGVPVGIRIVPTPEEADRIVLWLVPGAKSLFDADSTPLKLSLSSNRIDVARVRRLAAMKPTTLIVNFTSPWVINEVYDGMLKAQIPSVLATFGCTADALWDVLTGRFNPTGRMPFSTPLSEEAVARQRSDVPGYLEPKGYSLFRYGEGLRYK